VKKLNLRDKVMSEMGVITYKEQHKQKKLRPKPHVSRVKKTPLMKYVELVEGESIEVILLSGSLSKVSERIGVDPSTISKWIKRFKLRYSKDNLPNCTGCARVGLACQTGVCYVLIEMELYDLLELKRRTMLNEFTE
jgi:transposase-like protein